MSENAAKPTDERSYGDLLCDYLAVVAEIGPLLDEFGRPEPDRYESYARLRERKEELRTAIDDEVHDPGTIDVESVLDETFSRR